MTLDDLLLEAVKGAIQPLADKLAKIEGLLMRGRPPAEASPAAIWEPLTPSAKARGVARRSIIDAIHAGKVHAERRPCPGGFQFFCLAADLDREFPPRPHRSRPCPLNLTKNPGAHRG